MKRLVFLLLLAVFSLPGLTQSFVTVSGTVTDTLTGQPVPNHAVQIWTDSTGGLFYNNIVYTSNSGWYIDTIPLPVGIDSGFFWVLTLDCLNQPEQYGFFFYPGSLSFVQDFQICVNVPPCNADFTWYSTGAMSVQFINQSTGSTGPWYWEFGDGNTSALFSPQHTYATGGTYAVSLMIGDSSAGCWDMVTHTLVIADTILPGGCVADFTAIPDSMNQNTIQFTDQSTGNINSWFWEFGDGSTSTQQHPVHTYAIPGLYSVCLTVQGADSLCYDQSCQTVNVIIPTGCQAQFTWFPDSSLTQYQVQFIDLSLGNPYSWYWDFGDSTFSTEQHPLHLFAQPGTYYVCLTIEAGNGGTYCQSTWCNEVVVSPIIECPNYFTYQQNALSVSFTGHMVNGEVAGYFWNFGDGTSGEGETIIHTYPANGIYFVTLTTVTTDSLCSSTSSQSITVGDSTEWNQVYGQVFAGNFPMESGLVMLFSLDTVSPGYLPFIEVTVTDSSGIYFFPMVPQGDFLIYAIPLLPAGYMPTYYGDVIDWQNATVVSLGTANNPYDIYLVDAYNYTTGGGTILGQITSGLKEEVLDKMTIILFNEEGQGIWFDQVDVNGEFDFPDLGWGTYYLRVELAGCTSDLVQVTLSAENPVANIQMTFSGKEILGTGDPVADLTGGSIYPNPVKNEAHITIWLEKAALVTASVAGLTGQEVFSVTKKLDAGNHTLSFQLNHLGTGMYTLLISTENGPTIARKFVISH